MSWRERDGVRFVNKRHLCHENGRFGLILVCLSGILLLHFGGLWVDAVHIGGMVMIHNCVPLTLCAKKGEEGRTATIIDAIDAIDASTPLDYYNKKKKTKVVLRTDKKRNKIGKW